MATLYRPKGTTYRLKDGSYRTPDGERVTRGTPGAVRVVTQSKTWHGRYTDGKGERHQVKLSKSKEIARRMLAKLSGDSQLAGVGIDDPFEEHSDRPLLEHLEDYRRFLIAKGNVKQHVGKIFSQCSAVIQGCHVDQIGDLQPSAIVEFLAELRARDVPALPRTKTEFRPAEAAFLLGIARASVWRMVKRGQLAADGKGRARTFSREEIERLLTGRRGIGVETSNHYLGAMKSFSKWMVKDRRMPFDPLVCLSRQNANTDVRHPRRSLPADHFTALLAGAAEGKAFRGLAGADRVALYRLAAHTGFRASELASLTPASFDLAAATPTVTVEAAYSKHRRKDVQPIRADMAEAFRAYLVDRPRGQPVWPGTWPEAGAEMIRLDLAAAEVPYVDESGRVYDFHALRHQFISDLAAGGVHPKTAQELARHSTITLTMDYYTHLEMRDRAAALDKLPALNGGEIMPVQKTGTEGKKGQNPSDRCKARARR